MFPDYSADELVEITRRLADSNYYRLDNEVEDALTAIFANVVRHDRSGDATSARTLFEQALNMQALRIVRANQLDFPDQLSVLKVDDFLAAREAIGDT